MGKRVAIVGSGVSGLGALWALKSTDHEVHLYEADEVLGGHTNTVKFKHGDEEVKVDTGFIVFNTATYPNFINFLKSLDVKAVPTEMTFGISRDRGEFEWAGTSLSGIFAQWKNLFSLRMWRMIFDIIRFNYFALDVLRAEDDSEETSTGANGHYKFSSKPKSNRQESIGKYLERKGYSQAFREDYLIPMTAAVWSTGPDKASLEFPAMTLIRFMWNHYLLNTIAARPDWMTIPGGSQQYIDAVMRDIPADRIHLSTPVISVEDINDKVILQFDDEEEELFDHVILAVHGDQAHEIISASGTEDERNILSKFDTTQNTAYLHSDLSLMPKRRAAWSSWNYLTTTSSSSSSTSTDPPTSNLINTVTLTYNMNILQKLSQSTYGDVLVTLNPIQPPAPESIQGTYSYAHPLYNPAAIAAQQALSRIQNTRSISYIGAWTNYGFHEDGLSSGLRAAVEHLGAELPWEFVDSTFSRGRKPSKSLSDHTVRAVISWMQVWVGAADAVWGGMCWTIGGEWWGQKLKIKQKVK